MLIQGRGGELILVDITGDAPRLISRSHISADSADHDTELFTYPAIVGTRLFSRCEREIVCVDLGS